LKFVHNGRQSDLDLLILDKESYFGLGCQLKWLTHPDRIRDVIYADAELTKGIDQAELSLQWLNSKTPGLRQAIGLSTDELAKYHFRVAVLSKNTLGSAWTYKSGIPILSERLVDWILGSPHHRSLTDLWQVGEEHRYLPKRGYHYTDEDRAVEFGGIEFICERTGMRVKNLWNPAEDINLQELQ
jgi:hypothetical protein